jgi:hypothetical protein
VSIDIRGQQGAILGASRGIWKELPPIALTVTAVKNAKPSEKTKRLFDGRGLYLKVAPSGGKWWRFKNRFSKKEKRISLGVYIDVSLKEARNRRDEAHRLLANEIDPSKYRQEHKEQKNASAVNTFEGVAREWFSKHTPNWAKGHSTKIIQRLERDIFPWVGDRPISDITAQELLIVVRRIEDRGALETAHRALANCWQGCCGIIQTITLITDAPSSAATRD